MRRKVGRVCTSSVVDLLVEKKWPLEEKKHVFATKWPTSSKKNVHKWLPVSAPIVLDCSWSDQGCTLHTKTQNLPLGAERRQSKTQRKSKVERNDVRALYNSYSMWKIKNTCKTKSGWDEYPATWATSDISEYQIWRLGDPLVASKVQIENRFFLSFLCVGLFSNFLVKAMRIGNLCGSSSSDHLKTGRNNAEQALQQTIPVKLKPEKIIKLVSLLM